LISSSEFEMNPSFKSSRGGTTTYEYRAVRGKICVEDKTGGGFFEKTTHHQKQLILQLVKNRQ
jgi:hypothetical protein